MRLKYDLNVSALYITLTDLAVARTREIDDNTFVDLDEDGGVIGIEVVSIEHPWALDAVLRDFSIPPNEAAQLRAYFQTLVPGAAQGMPALSPEIPELSMNPPAPVCVGA